MPWWNPFSSSSSSSSSPASEVYLDDDAQRTEVTDWLDQLLLLPPAPTRTVQRIRHRKCEAGYRHEYLLFEVNDALFVTERDNNDPPDDRITNAKVANMLLATLTPDAQQTLPERTFARILSTVSEIVPDYGKVTNNCYWFSGSVYETIRVGLEDVAEIQSDDYGKRGRIWGFSVHSKLETVQIPPTIAGANFSTTMQPLPVMQPPNVNAREEVSPQRIIDDFSKEGKAGDYLDAYQKVHKKNLEKDPEDLDDPKDPKDDTEKQHARALRLLVGAILLRLAGPEGKIEDLPLLKSWLKADRASA